MRATRKTLRARVVTLKAHAAGLEKQAAAIKLSGDAAAVELVGPHGYEHNWHYVGTPGSHQLRPGMQVKAHHSVYGDVQATVTRVHKNGNVIATVHHSGLMGGKEMTGVALHKDSVTHIRSPVAASAHANDPARFLEMAFAEALTERVPPGKREGGQFHARTSLTRHDTPEEAARAVNAMGEAQRAQVRATTLPPPGFEWARGDRLAVARWPARREAVNYAADTRLASAAASSEAVLNGANSPVR
jgi:hypothetical protein